MVRNEELYRDKNILAPMVRVSTLPMRLLSIDYGADLVYCEEIIDRKILLCQQHENDLLGTTDFILSDGTVVFRTSPSEKEKLIFQIGTCDAKRAVAAAKKIQNCVAGVDVNMGCPKEFSVKGGMGAALIYQPDKVYQILTSLVKELNVPVTCKIRILPKLEDTLELVKMIASTGVSALAVHGRTKDERSRDPCRNHYIKAIAESVSIPIIANGGSKCIKNYHDIQKFKEETGASSIMLARAAEWNCSVFRKKSPFPVLDVIKEYMRYAFLYDNNGINTKYCVLQMLHDRMTETPEGDQCLAAKTLDDFATIWKMRKEYAEILKQREEQQRAITSREEQNGNWAAKRRKMEDGSVLIELPVRFVKNSYPDKTTPKQTLNIWCYTDNLGKPEYTTVERPGDRCYSSVLKLGDKSYTTPYWEKSKQLAEQGAAISCLIFSNKNDGRITDLDIETKNLHKKWRDIITSSESNEESKVEKEKSDVL